MSINPSGMGNNYGWNYSKPDKPGYSTILWGTVAGFQEVQKMTWSPSGQPGAPQFWPDGNPIMNIRMILITDTGDVKTFTFQPAGKLARQGKKRSVHMDLFNLSGGDMMNLVGKTIFIQTEEGHYGQGNPRPWTVGFADEGFGPYTPNQPIPAELTAPRVLANQAVSGGQVQAPVQYAQPAPQPVYQPTPYQQPAAPQSNRPQGNAMHAQMNPQIMQEMVGQAFGAPVQAVPVAPPVQGAPVGNGQTFGPDDYDADIPI